MKTILFVCTGNTCRSSMAKGLFKKIISEHDELKDIQILSAGTDVFFSSPATPQAVEAVQDMDVDITQHKSKQITEQLIQDADLILTMTNTHKSKVLSINPEAQNKIFTLKEFIDSDSENIDISDPFGASVDKYKECAQEIHEHLVELGEKIKNMKG